MTNREQVAAVLKGVTSLPTLPQVAAQLLRQAESEVCSLQEISALVERDPAVATRLLKLVNSPFYGIRRDVSSVQQALLLVGLGNLRSLVLSSSVLNLFPNSGRVGSFDRNAFWDHCLGVAMCARQIASETKVMDPDAAFTAGLVHDIGKLIEDRFLHAKFAKVVAKCDASGCTMFEAEQDILQVTHADIGQFVARHWKLPDVLCLAIGYHHEPADAPAYADAAAVVNLADEFARAAQLGHGGGADPKEKQEVRELAKLTEKDATRLRETIIKAFADGGPSFKSAHH